MSNPAVTKLERTYLALLLLPHHGLRARLQREMAACRDALALCEDKDAEQIQDEYEARAEQIAKVMFPPAPATGPEREG